MENVNPFKKKRKKIVFFTDEIVSTKACPLCIINHLDSYYLVVFGDCRDKNDGRHVVENVNPFATLVSLTAHVEHGVPVT